MNSFYNGNRTPARKLGRRADHRRRSRTPALYQELESRVLLSGGAPAALAVNDTIVLFDTAVSGSKTLPTAMQLQATSATILHAEDLLVAGGGSIGTVTFTYHLASATAATVVGTDSLQRQYTLALTFNSVSVNTGTFTLSDFKGTDVGVFIYNQAPIPQLAPGTLGNTNLTVAAGAGGGAFVSPGTFALQLTASGNFTIHGLTGGIPDAAGTYLYTPTDNADGEIMYHDTTHGFSGTILLGFTAPTAGFLLNTDASGTNTLHDFQVGSFAATINATTTTLAPSVNPVILGNPVTFQVTVAPNTVGSTNATGTVTFKDGDTVLGSQPLDSTGHASLTTSGLTVGPHAITAAYSGDTNFSGSTAALNEFIVYSHASNQAYVNQLYTDVLGRTADPGGLASWTALLDAGTDTFAQVATAFTSSREYDADIVNGFYVTYLGRQSEPGGLNDWVNLMQGGYNAEQIRAGILGSPEYFQDTGGTNTSFVTALYQSFLNRVPDPSGLAAWVNLLNTKQDTTAEVATGFLNSDENRTDIITGFYETYLHRAPDSAGLAAWKTLLANGITQPQIITAFVTSPEYLAINKIT